MKIEQISLQKKAIYNEGRMKLGRPVLESQSLFTRIVGFGQVPYYCC